MTRELDAPVTTGSVTVKTRPSASWSSRDWVVVGAFAFLIFLLVASLQHLSGAFTAPFEIDEASHYISGLMIRDYIASGHFTNPLAYLVQYHSHYPLVGIGAWPPLYYLVEAIWMLMFSASRVSILLMSATTTSLLALLLFCSTRQRLCLAAALIAALGFASSPVVQESSRFMMLDVPVALFCFLAMAAYARYLDEDDWRWSVAFGVVAVAGLMTKGNAGCLALLPALVVLVGGRFDLLRKPSFWCPVPIVLVLAGPWYVLEAGRSEQGFRFSAGLHYWEVASIFNGAALYHAVGVLLLGLAMLGILRFVFRYGERVDAMKLCAAALVLSVFVFQLAVPVALQERYLIPAIAPLLIVALLEAKTICTSALKPGSATSSRDGQRGWAVILVLLALSLVPGALNIPRAQADGMRAAAQQVWRNAIARNPSVLIATDPPGEAEAIAEIAMDDPRRPSLFAVRGSRLLGGGGYNNGDYEPRFADPASVMQEIDRYAIPFVLFRSTGAPGEWTHLEQLKAVREMYPDRWQVVYEDREHQPETVLYRIVGNDAKSGDQKALSALSAPKALQH